MPGCPKSAKHVATVSRSASVSFASFNLPFALSFAPWPSVDYGLR